MTEATNSTDRDDAAAAGLREGLHAMWASVAPGWAEHAEFIDRRSAALTEKLLDLAETKSGDDMLELAGGPGGLGIAAARRVGAEGTVLISDVAAEMTAIAAKRAADAGLANVTTRELDLEEIDEPDASYDVVLCREGLMMVPDPARAAGEIRRVLRPGGRAAIAVWGPRERNPWLGVLLDAVSAETGHPVPPPGIPGPFALDDRDRLAAVLSGAGLTDVSVGELPVPLHTASFEEWWSRTGDLAGPLSKLLASLPEPTTEAIRARTKDALAAYETSEGLEIPGVTLVAGARR